jgi:hypothetical protein
MVAAAAVFMNRCWMKFIHKPLDDLIKKKLTLYFG